MLVLIFIVLLPKIFPTGAVTSGFCDGLLLCSATLKICFLYTFVVYLFPKSTNNPCSKSSVFEIFVVIIYSLTWLFVAEILRNIVNHIIVAPETWKQVANTTKIFLEILSPFVIMIKFACCWRNQL